MRIAVILLLSGCASTEILTDEGRVCLNDEILVIEVEACLSSSCDTLVSESCRAELVDDTVVVSSQAIIRRRQRLGCNEDCGIIISQCALPEGAPTTSFVWSDGSPIPVDPCPITTTE